MTLKADPQVFTLTRDFAAPRPTLFACFTKPEHMRHWWGPKGVTIVKMDLDLRAGGYNHYAMQQPDGSVMWGKFVYREIVPPEKIVFINSFSDEAGGTTRHPMAPDWPLEMLSTFIFTELEPQRTRFTLTWTPHNATEAERAVFAASHASMTGGWTGSLDQLTTYIATL